MEPEERNPVDPTKRAHHDPKQIKCYRIVVDDGVTSRLPIAAGGAAGSGASSGTVGAVGAGVGAAGMGSAAVGGGAPAGKVGGGPPAGAVEQGMPGSVNPQGNGAAALAIRASTLLLYQPTSLPTIRQLA